MKKALLIMSNENPNIPSVVNNAKAYCQKKGFDYIGHQLITDEEVLKQPELTFEKIQSRHVDIVLTDDGILMLGEFSKERSLLSLIENSGMGCLDIEVDVATRELVENNRESIVEKMNQIKNKQIPILVLYEGYKGFENDEDFCAIRDYISEVLNIQQFSLLLYRKEHDEMADEFMDTLMKQRPDYIIQRTPFKIPKLQLIIDMLKVSSNATGIKIINMDDVHQALEQSQTTEININLNFN